ncbi:hypothetical protein GCM10018793_28810 [Streptomyces sulfonofaciens]|uniref:Uncharacterized protein n=1 Tax=Streptomyces sulfonofaciens TaxID=68272 RepID=A0A919G6P9_9ACTN|nr:hypothetical protein GCM10018793_28810 [Streptomyces sulfonofaciens]
MGRRPRGRLPPDRTQAPGRDAARGAGVCARVLERAPRGTGVCGGWWSGEDVALGSAARGALT